jgi:uncharacterized protein YlxW (UPF0749 family)
VQQAVVWRILALGVLLLIGILVVTSARLASGTDLRAERRTDLVGLIRAQQERVEDATGQVTDLQRQVDAEVAGSATVPTAARLEDLIAPASGAGVVVELDDAPIPASGVAPEFTADDYLVHEQDVHAVINALWAGGAEAMSVMDQRIIATSAVRCVGSTLLVHGQVYPPPYRVTAIGPAERMRRALDAAPRIRLYRQYVDLLGLHLDVTDNPSLTVPGYEGPLVAHYAQVVE